MGSRRPERRSVQTAVANRAGVDRVLQTVTLGARSTDGAGTHQTSRTDVAAAKPRLLRTGSRFRTDAATNAERQSMAEADIPLLDLTERDAVESPRVHVSTTEPPKLRPKPDRRAHSRVTTADIARRAYELYEERGHVDGHDRDDWFRAEQELRGRAGVILKTTPR
jgi:DUF2934 family protein